MKKKLFVVPAVLGTIGTFLTPYVLFKRFIGRFIIKDEMNLGKEWMPYKTELTVKYDELICTEKGKKPIEYEWDILSSEFLV